MNSCFSLLKSHGFPSSDRAARKDRCDLVRPLGVVIREAKLQDLNNLVEVLAQSFHPPIQWISWTYPLLKLGLYEDLRHRLQTASPHYRCLAALVEKIASPTPETQQDQRLPTAPPTESREELAGTIEIALRSPSIVGGGQYAYISNLAVSQPYRRQGIARKLLLSCEPTALDWGFREIYLHVLEDNSQAKQLYFSSGYRLYRVESNVSSWLLGRPRRLLLQKVLQSVPPTS